MMARIFIEDFARTVAECSDKTALVQENERLSYAELDRRSTEIACFLAESGVTPGQTVPILLDRGMDAVVAMLGVLKSGAAFCVINTEYPDERVAHIRKECGTDFLLGKAWMGDAADRKVTDAEFSARCRPDLPAVVVFTSGSTGSPKGVVLSHHALALAVQGNARFFQRKDSVLATASFSFVALVLDLLAPLCLGSTIHIADDGTRKDVVLLSRYIREKKITITFMPPQIARPFLAENNGILRCLLTGSERVQDLWSESTQIVSLYGASETCGPVCAFVIDKPYENTPLGTAYPGSSISLLDDEGRSVPPGMEGEICVSGQVASGYLNAGDMNAERFVPNPFGTGEHDGILFRSKDIGRLNARGMLEYVQRKDWMLKIRGFRVEPGEIEALMLRETPVDRAVVTGFEDHAGQMRLYACYTAKEDVAPESVLSILSRYLPDYMVPAFMEQVEAMPLNANGKIDRNRIAPPDIERWKAEYTPPLNGEESALCKAFEEVLGLARVGVLDDFVLLGGDSVSAVKLQALVSERNLSVADILSLRTPRALADCAQSTGGRNAPLEKAISRDTWPLTFAERQMAIEQGLAPDSVAYNVNLAFSLSGRFDVERLEKALQMLVRRHRILRSFYPMEHGDFVHRIAEDLPVTLVREACRKDQVAARIRERNVPYAIAAAPLFRFTLFSTDRDAWVLHLGFHHIIMDGLSGSILMKDLWSLYGDGKVLSDISQEADYLDYALWQQEHADASEGEGFFLAMFADGVPENEMPVRPVRPDPLPVVDSSCSKRIPMEKIEARARRYGVTPYALLMAAVGLTLAKYCGSEDVVLGAALNGRDHAQAGSLVGMFVNTLPVRLRPEGMQWMEDYVRDAAERFKQVQKYQTCPFERLVPLLAPERTPTRAPVFDLIVNYLDEIPLPHVHDLEICRFPIRSQELAMDLMLEMRRENGELSMELSYARSLYEDEVVQGMLDHLVTVLERMVCGGKMRLCDLSEVPDAERTKLLSDFAGTRTEANRGRTVVDLFRSRAQNSPENKAVVFDGKILSYAELDRLTDKLAADLSEKGQGRGNTVGILVARNPMMPVCAMGALKSGAAYLPLDPSYPTERLEFMLEDAGVNLVVSDPDLADLLPGYGGAFLLTDAVEAMQALPVPSRLPEPPRPEDLLVLLYTSGTTGKPKGVMLSHDNLACFCAWYVQHYAVTEKDGVAAYASFGFDAHLMDLYPALVSGACVHVIPEGMRLDLPGLNDYFNDQGVTLAFVTTQLGRQFAESMSNRSLRALSTGGETLVPIKPPAGYDFYNVYGPTECTILSTFFRVDKLYDRVPLGRALDNLDLYIVDKGGRLAPVGTAGELCIAGRQVALGYRNRPDLTEEKFRPNPFNGDPDYSRVYHTGDVARWLPGGIIDFVGRSDFQVKIRGFRVELTEIEGRIRQYPAVRDAAVLAMDAPAGGKCAVAYVVGRTPEEKIDVEALNRFIEEQLPPYMVPAATMQMEGIPLNPNGKVDRRKLPEPVYGDSASVSSGEGAPVPSDSPRTELEHVIAGILEELLGSGRPGLVSNLLRAGLTSLSAIKLAALLDERLGVAPAVRDIMQDPTILGIENTLVRTLLKGQKDTRPEPRPESGKERGYPLSQNQAGICFDCMKRPDTLAYNIPLHIRLPGTVDADRLANAARLALDAHPVVKARLVMEGERILQFPDKTPASVACLALEEEALDARLASFVRPFALFEEPLYRAEVIRRPGGLSLLLDFHHVVFDGGSLDIFLRDLGEIYEQGRLPEHLQEKLSAFDWALMEEEREGSSEWLADKTYFADMLASFEGASEIPADLLHRDKIGKTAEILRSADGPAIEAFCRRHGLTPAGLFLAVVAYVVARWVQSPEVSFAAISSGRSDARLRNSCGMFVRTLPLSLSLGENHSVLDFLRLGQKHLAEVVAHEGYPFTRIAEEHAFAPAIMYACELGVTGSYFVGGERAGIEPLNTLQDAKFKLSIHIEERDGSPVFAVQYDNARYSDRLMESFADTLETALKEILLAPDAPVRSISLVNERRKTLLAGFNHTEGELPVPVLHQMFEQAALRYPGRVALIAEDAKYTYAELDGEANRLARGLLSLGIRREERVAFLLKRTGRVLIAMLGTLKAGCAYIPVDPEYPSERIAHVLEDSGARYLLTAPDLPELAEKTAGFAGVLDMDALRLDRPPTSPEVAVMPGQLAYIIYTSGSTGKPKGVMVEHKGIANYVTSHPQNRHVHALVQDARVMFSITTVAFDMFLKESMTSLCNGLTLVFAGDEASRDPVLMAELFEKTGSDAFNTTPSRMMEYTEYPALLQAIRRCRVVMAGAERFPEALLARLRGGEGAAPRIFNTYGPTEISVSCNAKELTGADHVTIGAPLLNVHEYVVDADDNPLPPNMVGELLVGGMGVARGYVNLAGQTDERFVLFQGERVYRTGDYARWTEEGEIEVLGRNDNQIKLRGLRIELEEIEKAILRVSGVRNCAAAIRNLNGNDHICAWYLADGMLDPVVIRESLSRTLPAYMIPAAYRQIEAMPKTQSGKNDLRMLPDPELLRSGRCEAPRNALEKELCAVFAKVLGLEQVGASDGFFDLGGSSLAVTRIIIEARERGIRGKNETALTYGDVFAHPSPRELAVLLEGGGTEVAPPQTDTDYDYSAIHRILAEGDMHAFRNGARRPVGNVLLTGATGFLGAHVLHALLQNGQGTVYCLVRRGRYESVESRLKHILYYYFEDSFEELFGSRIHVVEGDITDAALLERIQVCPIDTVINCAANVTHFARDTGILDVNTGGVLKLVGLALAKGIRLVQISTTSVAGFSIANVPDTHLRMDETMLHFGQNLENQYVHSKFMAERLILEAVTERGLDAKIMRVGNLMARSHDGEFQINSRANSFIGRLRAYESIGCFPYSSFLHQTELAPIDSTARAVLLLAEAPEKCRIFHPYNNHMLFMGDIIACMQAEGLKIEMVEDEIYEKALSAAMRDKKRSEQLTSLIAYQNLAQGRTAVPLGAVNDFTTQALLRMNWCWPETSSDYLGSFIRGLVSLGFFGAV